MTRPPNDCYLLYNGHPPDYHYNFNHKNGPVTTMNIIIENTHQNIASLNEIKITKIKKTVIFYLIDAYDIS